VAMKHGRADKAGAGASMELVCCGKPFPGHEIRVMGPNGAVGDRQVGEVWLRGPSVTAGYFGNPEATAESFSGGWLKTGDLGYTTADGLYLCGRAKDLIILNGKNYFPQDIEAIVSRIDGIRDMQCVAFSKLDAHGAEIAVVVAEARKATQALHDAIIRAVRSELGLTIGEVHLIKRSTLPKTSSGKVRRREAKMRLEMNELELLSEMISDGPLASAGQTAPPAAN